MIKSFKIGHFALRTNFQRKHFIHMKIHWISGQVLMLCSGFSHLLENLEKWEYTWKTWKNHGILQKIIIIMEKLNETWKNIWVDYKSLHARGRPQVLCVCLLSGGWNKCSILCMHWNGPRVNLNCQTCVCTLHIFKEARWVVQFDLKWV